MPETAYHLNVYNASGILQYVVQDFLALNYTKQVNAPGMLQFVVDDSHDLVGNAARDWQVEVRRSRTADSGESNAISEYTDFYGFVRDEERAADSDGNTRVTYTCPGQMDYLRRSIVAYPAGIDARSQFTNDPAETVLKNLVKYNATSSGTTADGRIRNVDTWGSNLTVQADGAAGNNIDIYAAWRNLLAALQDVARIGGGDFDLVKTAATTWDFRWYLGQLGTDRSASVVFALQYGNMANPVLRRGWLDEQTVAIVAGQGAGAERATQVRTGTNYDATVNSLEFYVDARDVASDATLQDRGDIQLDRRQQARDTLTFNVVQTPGSLYGLHYFLGDKVTSYYQGVSATQCVNVVTIELQPDGVERIGIQTDNA